MTAILCRCGCGEAAPLAQRNNAGRGHVKGQPLAYRSGHNYRRIVLLWIHGDLS